MAKFVSTENTLRNCAIIFFMLKINFATTMCCSFYFFGTVYPVQFWYNLLMFTFTFNFLCSKCNVCVMFLTLSTIIELIFPRKKPQCKLFMFICIICSILHVLQYFCVFLSNYELLTMLVNLFK